MIIGTLRRVTDGTGRAMLVGTLTCDVGRGALVTLRKIDDERYELIAPARCGREPDHRADYGALFPGPWIDDERDDNERAERRGTDDTEQASDEQTPGGHPTGGRPIFEQAKNDLTVRSRSSSARKSE